VPKEACRLRAVGLKNWWESQAGKPKGRKVGFPKLRKRTHGSRLRYDAERARPASVWTVKLPAVPGAVTVRENAVTVWENAVTVWENMARLTDRLDDGRARIIGCTVREKTSRRVDPAPVRGCIAAQRPLGPAQE
jgi:putative transposase